MCVSGEILFNSLPGSALCKRGLFCVVITSTRESPFITNLVFTTYNSIGNKCKKNPKQQKHWRISEKTTLSCNKAKLIKITVYLTQLVPVCLNQFPFATG